jgi:two-component system, cell cycle sensor histidine kinase and response regulator CckA
LSGNASDAVQLARQFEGKVHLLLIDVDLSEKRGRMLAPLVLALNPGAQVICLLNCTDNPIIEQDLPVAGAHFLPKPFTLEVLARKVREVLDSSPAHP